MSQAPNDDDERTTPIGLFNFAESYWLSAQALQKTQVRASHADSPVCFLYYHAIELYLKAYLRAKGHSVEEVRTKFGHSSTRLKDAASKHGLHFDDVDVEVLKIMADTNSVIESRYLRTGYFTRPTHDALDRTCRSLRQSIGQELKQLGHPVRWI